MDFNMHVPPKVGRSTLHKLADQHFEPKTRTHEIGLGELTSCTARRRDLALRAEWAA